VTIDCTSKVDAESATRTVEWSVFGPESDPLERMRAIRDAISEHVSAGGGAPTGVVGSPA
jgi:hypothetical protein